MDGTEDPSGTMVSLCVDVPFLLSVLRLCKSRAPAIEVRQIYDWWCG